MGAEIGEGVPEAMPSAGSRTYCKDSGFKGSNRDSIGSAFRCDMLSVHSLFSGILSEQSHEVNKETRRVRYRSRRFPVTAGKKRRSERTGHVLYTHALMEEAVVTG